MKVLVEIEGKPKNGDILVYDEKKDSFKAVSMQTFCHEIFCELEKTNGRIERMKEAHKSLNDQVNKIANIMKGEQE